MAVINTSAFNFAEVVQKFIKDYSFEVLDDVFETVDEVAKEAVTRLRQTSSAQFGNGDYAKGWTKKLEKGRVSAYATVYGKKPTYALAHLLENGHVTRNGTGRTYARTPAHPHIQEINDWAQDEAYDRIVQKLEKRL